MRKRYIKILSVIIIFQTLFFSASPVAYAGIPTSVLVDVPAILNWAKEYITQIAVAALKKAAINMIMSKVANTVGNGSNGSGAMFITDWRDAIESQPEKATKIQMQNLFSSMGAGAGTNYVAADGSEGYVSGMIAGASASVLDSSIPEVINLAEYGVNDISEVFSGNNMRAFLTAFGSTSKIGNEIEYKLYAKEQENKFMDINRRIAETQAIANSGYYSKLSGNNVVTPGASIRDLVASAQNAPFVALASSSTLFEAVSSLVSRTIATTVNKGFGSNKQSKEKTDTSSGSSSAGDDLKGSFGSLSVGTN